MKRAKIYISFGIGVALITGYFFIFKPEPMKEIDTHKIKLDYERQLENIFNPQNIKVNIDNIEKEYINNKDIFISETNDILYPLDNIQEDFDCAVYKKNENEFVIEKLDNLIEIDIMNHTLKLNNEQKKFSTTILIKNNKVYISIQDIADAILYSYKWNRINSEISFSSLTDNSLPKFYDARKRNRAVDIRDQGEFGTCWAFAALGAFESSLMPSECYDFSADHITLKNDFIIGQNDGGEYTMALSYFSSWKGPVLEQDDPYGDGVSVDGLSAVKHLQEAVILQEKDYDAIKEYVFKYGAVQTSIYSSLSNSPDSSMYYNSNTSSYYFNQLKKSNHDIVIVGWDDNYSKENFNIVPKEDGAFICRNSWGESFGEKGYFYISYCDNNIGISNLVYTKIQENNNYDNIYQSDLLGWTGQVGYNSQTAYFANVYQANSTEFLKAISFYATGIDTKYKVYFVENFNSKEDFNRKRLLKSGNLKQAGYYTIDLEDKIELQDSKKFAIIVEITTPNQEHPIAVEYNIDERTGNMNLMDGEGYISSDGKLWSNIEQEQNCNLCLKAFTNNMRE